MSRVIVITSGKGGVGKTSVTLGIGRGLSAMGYKTLLIDTDMGLNNLDVLMNVEDKIVFDISDVADARCRPRQALVEDPDCENLMILPSVRGYRKNEVSGQMLRAIINSLQGFDYTLIDCPAGIELGFHRAVSAASEALVVTTPHISAVKDAGKVIGILGTYKIDARLIVNRVRGDMVLDGEMASPDDIRQALGIPLCGIIPENDEINALSANGEKPKSGGNGSKAFSLLCHNIVYGTSDMYDYTAGYKGIFGGRKRALKKHL